MPSFLPRIVCWRHAHKFFYTLWVVLVFNKAFYTMTDPLVSFYPYILHFLKSVVSTLRFAETSFRGWLNSAGALFQGENPQKPVWTCLFSRDHWDPLSVHFIWVVVIGLYGGRKEFHLSFILAVGITFQPYFYGIISFFGHLFILNFHWSLLAVQHIVYIVFLWHISLLCLQLFIWFNTSTIILCTLK